MFVKSKQEKRSPSSENHPHQWHVVQSRNRNCSELRGMMSFFHLQHLSKIRPKNVKVRQICARRLEPLSHKFTKHSIHLVIRQSFIPGFFNNAWQQPVAAHSNPTVGAHATSTPSAQTLCCKCYSLFYLPSNNTALNSK